jgi:hypothetical protein
MRSNPKPVFALAWTHHARKRLGERVGSQSEKIQKEIEQELVDNRFEIIEAYDDGTVRVALNTTAAGRMAFILALLEDTTLVITVLPSSTTHERGPRENRR